MGARMGRSRRRRGLLPGGPAHGAEPTITDVVDGQRLVARLVERPGGVDLIVPADDEDRHLGTFPNRRAALSAFDEQRARS